METIFLVLNFISEHIITPLFLHLSNWLVILLIRPMDFLHIAMPLQVFLLGILTALLSWRLRTILKIPERTEAFRRLFQRKKQEQGMLAKGIDNKYARDALLRVSDEEIDEEYNAFMADYFSRYATAYLLPAVVAMAWIQNAFPKTLLFEKTGSPLLIDLGNKIPGIQGLSVAAVFLAAYLLSLICLFSYQGFKKRRRGRQILKEGT